MDRFNTNEGAPEEEYNFEISLTIQEIEDFVSYTKNKNFNIKYVVENILDQINPEVYGVSR